MRYTTTISPVALAPEEQKALSILRNYINEMDFSAINSDVPEDLNALQTNTIFPIQGIVTSRKLPCGINWFWNQTHSTKSVTIPFKGKRYSVDFKKLLCRKKRKSSDEFKPPKYKLWLFLINFDCNTEFTVIWCERGIPPVLSDDEFVNSCINWDYFQQ